jgi:hypothetical protein
MIVYIPQNIDPFNTHLKNLIEAYTSKGIEVIVGYKTFISESRNIIPDVIHFHFPQALLHFLKYNETLFFEKLDSLRNQGVSFLYTAHDIRPFPEITKIDYPAFFVRFLKYINLFIHHGESSIDIMKKEFPVLSDKKHIICHHGDYLNDMKNFHECHGSARTLLKLPINKKIILVFGQLQYKNTSFAKEVLDQVRKKHQYAILLMAGVFPLFKYNRLNLLYYRFNNIFLNMFRFRKILYSKRFSQFETYLLFIASDVVFLPHKTGLTSGIISLAATLGKPFVYPNIGVFREQAIYCYAEEYEKGNVLEASCAISKIITSGIRYFDNSKWLENNNWEKHVDRILSNL